MPLDSTADHGLVHGRVPRTGLEALGLVQGDVEQLIRIAAQLLGAIERQIHHMEEFLHSPRDDQFALAQEKVFREQLVRVTSNLNFSVDAISKRFGDQP